MIALLEYMYIEINRGSSSFYCSHACGLSTKQWLSSQSLSYYVHVSAQFLQTNEIFAAIAWLFTLTRKDVGMHILLVLDKTISALSLITALF